MKHFEQSVGAGGEHPRLRRVEGNVEDAARVRLQHLDGHNQRVLQQIGVHGLCACVGACVGVGEAMGKVERVAVGMRQGEGGRAGVKGVDKCG